MVEPLSMFVEFNAATHGLVFHVNRRVQEGGPLEFTSREGACEHPLARRLMAVEGVERVALSADSVSLFSPPGTDLEEIAARVELVLRHYFEAG